ncbi:MAG: nitrate reductase [Desulfobacteraceae bacterium]
MPSIPSFDTQFINGGFKSIFRGLLPFGLSAMRQQPLLGGVTFIFHLCVVMTPLFLLAHIVLFYESWQLQWPSLPDLPADIMTMMVIAGTLFFAFRRWIRKEVRAVSNFADWALLIVVNGVFLTGLLAYHHWGPYRPLLITHVLLGEILLLMVPFTKLVHMVLFFFTRGYLGAEYEIVLDGEGL